MSILNMALESEMLTVAHMSSRVGERNGRTRPTSTRAGAGATAEQAGLWPLCFRNLRALRRMGVGRNHW